MKNHNTQIEIPSLTDKERAITCDISHQDSFNETSTSTNYDNISKVVSHPSRTLYYPSLDKCVTLEADLQDFVSSLFWVLESKRLVSISNIDKEKQPFLCAPFERKDLIGMDLESRTHRKRCVGRWRKQVGDLSLQAGLLSEALEQYQAAADVLRPANDWLWLAGSFEGLCAASIILLYPHLRRPVAIQRNGSLTGEGFNSRIRSNSSGVGVRSLPPDIDSNHHFLKNRLKFKHSLGPDEVIEKYHEAVVHYSKYRNAGVIETEASIKAVHVLIEQRKYLSAAEFLQNVVFINLHLSDEEKIQRFTALSELYSQLGFKRKSSFFRRVSAMRCVAPMTTIQPNWTLCYQLLLESIDGYKLSLDPALLSHEHACGWHALQVQILQELTGTARRLGNVPLAIRHASLLVHLLLIQQQQVGAIPILSSQEQAEMAKQLDQLAQRSEMPLHPGPLALENGTIIPPVSLTLLPKIVHFKLQPPGAVLAAQRLMLEDEINNGPFLFTPIQFGSFRKQPTRKTLVEMDFQWVEGDHCEVLIQVINPSSYELRITNMQLLTEDVEFESESSCIILPPAVDQKTTPTVITLSGIPRRPGLLKIVGYSMTVLGLRNHCKLKSAMPLMGSAFFSIHVVPALPRLSVEIASPNHTLMTISESQSVATTSSVQLYAGQSTECNLTLVNTSSVSVESFDLELVHGNKLSSSQVFSVSVDNLKAQLPWQSGTAVSVTVYVQGASDFILPAITDYLSNLHSGDDSNSLPSLSGPPSIFSRLSNHTTVTCSPRNKAKRAESLVSVRSGTSSVRSGGSSNLRIIECQGNNHVVPRTVAVLLKLQYSGGPGYIAGFCRSNGVGLTVEILPSVIITKWDVLPAETPSHCYLVLDILNATQHEMELQYSSCKHIAIEALDTCRIPVPVERCPLVKLTHVYTEKDLSPEQQLEKIARICSEHISSLVELKWSLSGVNQTCTSINENIEQNSTKVIKGKASLSGLRIAPSMLDLLHIPPIQLEVELNNEIWSAERTEFICVVGDVLNVTVGLFNALSKFLGPLNLQISVYQDLQNGTFHRRLDTRLLTIGSDHAVLEKMEPNSNYKHCCGIIFFTPGTYKLDVVCSLKISTQNRESKSNLPYDSTNEQHVWKFVPSIEIIVSEPL
ncbi:protein brunelleschi-like isoform X2 [Daphnia pulex]|nr:protein brunelleschi-like isoform X2 [Daphnia pulex]